MAGHATLLDDLHDLIVVDIARSCRRFRVIENDEEPKAGQDPTGRHPPPRVQKMPATTVAAAAPRMTTNHGGTAHNASSKKATIPIAKSAGAKIALVHTGR